MRARFYYAALHPKANALAEEMEKSLTEISIAFGHSFLMKAIGLEDVPRTMEEENAVTMLLGADETEAAGRMGCFAIKRSFLFEKAEEQIRCDVLSPALKDADAQQLLFDYAARNLLPPPIISEEDGAERVMKMIRSPETASLSVCGYTAGVYVKAAARAMMAKEELVFDTLIGGKGSLLAVPASAMNLYAPYYALAEGLETILHLKREANCLQTTVHNVLTAGWRAEATADGRTQAASLQEICTLINEQLSLVGEMMNRDMIR